jgi:nucleoside-diphosphate-sugar epimerase
VHLNARGQILRDFVYLDDLVRLILGWIRQPHSGMWNIAAGQAAILSDLMSQLRGLSGASFAIIPEEKKTSRDFDLIFDTARLRRDFPADSIRPAAQTFEEYVSTLRIIADAATVCASNQAFKNEP